MHRYGSNIWNGAYYADYDHRDTPSHYSAGRSVNVAALRSTYEQFDGMSDAQIAEMVSRSPLRATQPRALPRCFSLREVDFGDLFADSVMTSPVVGEEEAKALVEDLGSKNHWLTPLGSVTHPYRGNGPDTPCTGTAYQSRHVGDVHDTSPYDPRNPPLIAPYTVKDRPLGIQTSDFIANMGRLIAYVAPVK